MISRAVRDAQDGINLVAATNSPSRYVADCMKSATNAVQLEGHCGGRFHEGAAAYDRVESFCAERAAALFGVSHASVQAWRCTNGLLAVVRALADLGDTVMGLECASGGYYATSTGAHLIGKLHHVVTYTVSERDHRLDYDLIRDRVRAERPKIIFAGDTSYSRDWDWQTMRAIADEAGAYLVADISQTAGLIAAGLLSNPAPLADITIFATYKTFRGPHGCIVLARSGEVFGAVRKRLYPELQGSIVASTLAGLAAAIEEAGSSHFRAYQRRVVAASRRLAKGVAAQGVPVVTGGTDNHAFIAVVPECKSANADIACRNLTGAGFFTNKTPIPFDRRPLSKSSGVRIGAAHLSNFDLEADEIDHIASRVGRIISELT